VQGNAGIFQGVSRSSISVKSNLGGILKTLADIITALIKRSQVEALPFIADALARSVVHTPALAGIVFSDTLAKLRCFDFLSTEASAPSNGVFFNQ